MQSTLKKAFISVMALLMITGCAGAPEKEPEQTPEASPISEVQEAPAVEETAQEHDIANLAIFGIDDKSDGIPGKRSDLIKIASFDYDDNTVKVISVARDLKTFIGGNHQKSGWINEAVEYGGAELQLATLNETLDLDIENYIEFDYEAFKALVDALGGVDIELTQEEIDQTNKPLNIKGKAGTYTLNGEQALMYTRIYKIDSEEGRMDRSAKVIKAAAEKAKELGPMDLVSVINKVYPHVRTNLHLDEVVQYVNDIMDLKYSDIQTYVIPSDATAVEISENNKGKVVEDYEGLAAEVHKIIYGENVAYEASDYVKGLASQVKGE